MSTNHSRRHVEARAKVDRERDYQPAEAIALVKGLASAKFDESVEVHVRTGLNVRHADEQLRGTIALPNGLGQATSRSPSSPRAPRSPRPKRPVPTSSAARTSRKRIEEGFDEFDVAIATPDLMAVVGRLGRILGPSGKMPNPKVGTVTMDVAKAVRRVEVGQDRVPHRPHRDRPPRDRQGLLRGARAAGELRRRRRRADPRQAFRRQRPLPAHDHARLDDGARRESRPFPHPRYR